MRTDQWWSPQATDRRRSVRVARAGELYHKVISPTKVGYRNAFRMTSLCRAAKSDLGSKNQIDTWVLAPGGSTNTQLNLLHDGSVQILLKDLSLSEVSRDVRVVSMD